MPKVSVIIPVYNTEPYLRECLDSVVGQTLKDIEIICVDDGSTDNSLTILYEYAEKDTRIKILTQNNLYAGVARNNGLAIAKGEYIHFLDADDWVEKNAYEKWYGIAKERDAEVCFCQYETFNNQNGKTECKTNILTDGYIQESSFIKTPKFFIYNSVVPWNKIYKRNFLQEHGMFFDDLICANDRAFYFRMISKARKVVIVKDYWIHYRKNNPNSLIGETRLKNFDCHFRSFENIWKVFEQSDVEIKSMIIDITMKDFLNFYEKAIGTTYESAIEKQLQDYLKKMDFSCLQKNIKHYGWFFKFEKMLKNDSEMMGKNKKEPRIIVSLTTFPDRVETVSEVIRGMLQQTVKPYKILLYLADTQFPDKKIPDSLSCLQNDVFEIKYCDDLKPHKKYFYAMQEYPDDIIITVDDDIFYPVDLIEELLRSYEKYPYAVSCMRGHVIKLTDQKTYAPYKEWKSEKKIVDRPSLLILPTGVGGVLYPPGCLYKAAFDKEAIEKCCLFTDDLWLKWMQLKKDVPCVLVKEKLPLQYIDGTQEKSLWKENDDGGRNNIAWKAIIDCCGDLNLDGKSISENLYNEYQKIHVEPQKASFSEEKSSHHGEKNEKVVDYSLERNILKKIHGGIQCYKEHGLKYTLKRTLEHLGIPMGIELYKSNKTDNITKTVNYFKEYGAKATIYKIKEKLFRK